MGKDGTHHAVDYIELPSSDLAASKRFYESAFGWIFTDYGPDYAGFTDSRGAREAGGLRREETVSAGGVLVVLYSTDLEASLASVQSAGGDIVAPIFDFPGGRRFEFLDPSGNRLGVWTQR